MKPAALMVLLLVSSGCTRVTPINKILSESRDYHNRKVTIEGKVTESVNVYLVKFFVVNDGTGEIYVKTEKAVPTKSQIIRVTGKINQAFKIGDKEFVVLVESNK